MDFAAEGELSDLEAAWIHDHECIQGVHNVNVDRMSHELLSQLWQ